jgi:ribulose-phosphate 3-epimerase
MRRAPFWTEPGGEVSVAPSILSANFANLEGDVARVKGAVSAFHLDVMDGHFVPNITFGPPLVRALRAVTDGFLDCHLMIEEPLRYADAFVEAGVDLLTIHAELFHDPSPALRRLRALGVGAGLAVNPDTPLARVADALRDVDLLLVMSVHPGFGGQAFIAGSVEKVRAASELRAKHELTFAIEVDGGVCADNAGELADAGADVLVAGSAVFGAADPAAAARAIANAARARGRLTRRSR